MQLLICKECKKPESRAVKGKPRSGKKLCRKLNSREDLPFTVAPCGCLGKCKKGPVGLLLPANRRLHGLTVKRVKKLAKRY